MAAPVYESGANGTGGASPATSGSCNKPTGTVENDLLLALVHVDDDTDPQFNESISGWTFIGEAIGNTWDGRNSFAAYRKVAGGSEPSSYTFDWTNSKEWNIGILRFSGVDTTTPINASAFDSVTDDSPSVTTSVNDCLIVAILASNGLNVPGSPPSGMTMALTWDNGGAARTGGATATVTLATAGASGAKDWAAAGGSVFNTGTVAIAPPSSFDPASGFPWLHLPRPVLPRIEVIPYR